MPFADFAFVFLLFLLPIAYGLVFLRVSGGCSLLLLILPLAKSQEPKAKCLCRFCFCFFAVSIAYCLA